MSLICGGLLKTKDENGESTSLVYVRVIMRNVRVFFGVPNVYLE